MAETRQNFGPGQGERYSAGRGEPSISEKTRPGTETAVGAIKDKAKEIVAEATEMAGKAKEKAEEWASTAATKADETRSTVGHGIEVFADKVRQTAPKEGVLASAASNVADRFEAAGSYIREHDLPSIGRDAKNLIRRYPLGAVLLGLGVGFMLSRATRR